MDSAEHSDFRELEQPPTLVAESGSGKISGGSNAGAISSRMASVDEKSAKMPVLQPNVGIATRTKSGRIHKPTRNFNSDEYVVPTLVKRRLPNNSRPQLVREKQPAPVVVSSGASGSVSDIESIRLRLEQKFPKAALTNDDETPFAYITSVCYKDSEKVHVSVADIHAKVKNTYKTWTKGPFRLREDEVKFVQECIVKPEWSRISVKEWGIQAEALKHRMERMRRPGNRVGRPKKKREDLKKTFSDLGNKIVKGVHSSKPDSDDEIGSDEFEAMEEDMADNSSSHSSRFSTRSKDTSANRGRGEGSSKTPSLANDEFDLSLGSVDFAGDDLKEEMFDDLESALVNESRNKSSGNSMVAALHATLHSGGIDPSQFEPPSLEKDSTIFGLDDMEGTENFFENMDEPTFGDADTDTPGELTDEALAELEGQVLEDEDVKPEFLDGDCSNSPQPSSSGRRTLRDNQEKLDLSALEIEESSGNVRLSGAGGDLSSPGVTMISTKMALMCALKISEDFLPISHEKYLDRLEVTERYRHDELNDIRRRFNMKPKPKPAPRLGAKRKLSMDQMILDSSKKPKVALKPYNGTDKPKAGIPYLRSAYARCRKFLEDETTVIEKLGNNKILAAGNVIEIDYENYLKESDVEIPYDDGSDQKPKLLPPSSSNCHAPPCRLGCICSSISEDMPPRKHCGRPKCFFECNCQQLVFNNSDDGDIRSRLRPRVSLLNWRAESTEKEKEPMTSYRQMERGTHFIRVRRQAAPSERLRREFVFDGKVVERTATKVTKERLRTKALLQSSHRRMMGKHDPHAHAHVHPHKFLRIVPDKADHKPKETLEQKKKKYPASALTVDLKLLDVDVTPAKPEQTAPTPSRRKPFMTRKEPSPHKMSSKEAEEMHSIIKEITEDCQLLQFGNSVGFFSWSKRTVHPKVIMYQPERGDGIKAPWLYLPIPPQGYSWICHTLKSSFQKTDYVYIPEIQCCISSQALAVNMNTAFARKKGVVIDVKASGNNAPGIGKIYFFPDLPKVLICGPFRTHQTTNDPNDEGNVPNIGKALTHMEKLRFMKHFGNDQSWKQFTTSPTIFPIKKRNDNETKLAPEESRKLFAQLLPSLISAGSIKQVGLPQSFKPVTPKPAFVGWSSAVKFVGFDGAVPNNAIEESLAEVITLM